MVRYSTSAALWEPVTLSELKSNARIEHSEQDALLGTYLSAARQWAEKYCGQRFAKVEVTESREAFPCDRLLELYVKPMLTLTSVKYYDADSVLQTLSASEYVSDATGGTGLVQLKSGHSWPDTEDRIGAVEVKYYAGPATVDDVPTLAKQAIILMATFWVENPENALMGKVSAPEVTAAERLLNLLIEH